MVSTEYASVIGPVVDRQLLTLADPSGRDKAHSILRPQIRVWRVVYVSIQVDDIQTTCRNIQSPVRSDKEDGLGVNLDG